MKTFFKSYNFKADSVSLIETINSILEEYEEQGYDLTLRQLYYQLVSRDFIPNSQKSYSRIGNLVNKARMSGMIDWDMIVDRGRDTIENTHWSNLREIIETAASSFRLDKWKDQPTHIEVMVEKQALEGVLVPVCLELDVPFTSNKGYSSQSFMYRKGGLLRDKMDEGKDVRILYLGDHDPSGLDMDRDVFGRLKVFSSYDDSCDYMFFHRLALTWDQIEEFNPPPNPAKITDSRAKGYIMEHGKESWELDAMEPKVLARLVRDFVDRYRDPILWEESLKKEQEQKDLLSELLNELEGEY